jgi:putative addiction module component (TIGR02574 family)
MTQAVARILEEAGQLSATERADLADRLVESLGACMPPETTAVHIEEVRRRIAQVESGEVTPISSEIALAQVRKIVDSARSGN